MRIGSVAFRACMYLACNPNKELTAAEVAARYHVSSAKSAREAMAVAVQSGWLVNATGKRGRGNMIRYAPGPRLLRERGELYE